MKNWIIKENKLYKEFYFNNFDQAIDFINQIGNIANKLNHHPEIYNYYNHVSISLYTKEHNKITEIDYLLAEKIEQI